MKIIELYIDGKLCDTDKNFGARLNRKLLSPSELNAKDAQFSFSVTLPFTAANNEAFGYSNVEETKNKFNRLYNAELYINGVRIFKGVFKPSEIDKQYKGNLYVPAAKSIKDVFGNIKLAENPEYRIEFKDFAEYITKYNKEAANGPQMAIFPYVLYGVLPKVPLTSNPNDYSARNIWDDSVRMGMQDLAPSINPLLMLKHIFNSRGYKLGGTAFDDERLARLYMSYKNETEYVQPWNYGHHAFMKVRGNWENVISWWEQVGSFPIERFKFERNGYQTDYEGLTYYCSDLFDSTNVNILKSEVKDPGGNILIKEFTKDNIDWKQCQIRIPSSGFYKVRLKADIQIDSRRNWRSGYEGMQFVGGNASNDSNANSFEKKRYEIKILRDRGTGDFGLVNGRIDKVYYRNNLSQNNIWDEENLPKYFPNPGYTASGKESEVMLVDPAQNPNYVAGLAWGWKHDRSETANPLIGDNMGTTFGTVLAAKSGLSWDVSANPDKPAKVAIPSGGYMKYGRIGDFDDESENPNVNIDYSDGDWLTDKALDDNGNLINLPEGVTATVLYRFRLSRNSTFNLSIPASAGFKGKIFIHSSTGSAAPKAVYEFDANGKATFRSVPGLGIFGNNTYLTIYLAYTDSQPEDAINFDISNDLVINREYDPEDIIDWEQTNKYKISVKNAPESYAKRNSIWTGEGEVNAVVWFDAGEIITIASVSDEGRYKRQNSSGKYGWTKHAINFELELAPFRTNEDWLRINSAGNGTGTMDWNDPINFDTDSIDLVKFLPADVKTDDFIDNFCKAFNLILRQTSADSFSLDVKQTKAAVSPLFIDLDSLAAVRDRKNSPLGLPSMYKIGFTVDQEEEGYAMTGDDGGGSFETGAVEESIVEQKSNFSYNWFKDIKYTEGGASATLPIPVISKAEVWADTMAYPDAMAKRFTSLAARFWYYDGLLNDLGAAFKFNNKALSIAKVSNSIEGLIVLNYKDEDYTILETYFTVLVNSSSHYTELEGYLTPEQYERLDGSIMAMFNGDQYYVAEISGYDPLGKNKTKIKLIRKI